MGLIGDMSFGKESYAERQNRELAAIPPAILPLLKKMKVEDDWGGERKEVPLLEWAFTQIVVKPIEQLPSYTRPFTSRRDEKKASRWGEIREKEEEWIRFFLLLPEPKELSPGDHYPGSWATKPGEHYAPPVGKSPEFGKIAIVRLDKMYSNRGKEVDSRCMTVYLPK